jgi:hypothetical protein
MKVVTHEKLLTMGWCLQCHNNPTEQLRPVSEVTNLTWGPEGGRSQAQIGTGIKYELQVKPPTNCQSCHR